MCRGSVVTRSTCWTSISTNTSTPLLCVIAVSVCHCCACVSLLCLCVIAVSVCHCCVCVSAVDSVVPALVSWWRGDQAYLLDVTHPDAVQWLLNNTARLRNDYNVTSFKWDAGDGNWLPRVYSTHRALDGPDEFSRLFVDMAYRSVCSCG